MSIVILLSFCFHVTCQSEYFVPEGNTNNYIFVSVSGVAAETINPSKIPITSILAESCTYLLDCCCSSRCGKKNRGPEQRLEKVRLSQSSAKGILTSLCHFDFKYSKQKRESKSSPQNSVLCNSIFVLTECLSCWPA